MPEFRLEVIDLHMAAAHFPMGLLLSSLFFDILAAVTKKQSLRDTAFWTHMLGVISSVVAIILGLVGNPYKGETSDLAAQAIRHQWFGIAGAVVFGLLALWRIRAHNQIAAPWSFLYWTATVIGVAVMSVTGYLGGHMM